MDDERKGVRMTSTRTNLFACALLVALNGCVGVAGLQDWQYERANKARASRAFYDTYDCDQRAALGADFEEGYRAGYVTVSTGKDCRVPPVAPQKYWAAKYQCCEGQQAVQDWFRGFECGLTAAQACGHPAFNDVPTSACPPVLNKTACGTCYAADPCNCNARPATMQAPIHTQYFSETDNPTAIEKPQAPPAHATFGEFHANDDLVRPVSHGLIGGTDLCPTAAGFEGLEQ